MALSRIRVAIAVAVAGGMLWIEHSHRISIALPSAVESIDPAAAVCPENDSVPFSAACMAIIASAGSDVRAATGEAASGPSVPADVSVRVGMSGPACPPNNENRPYSAKCLRFLSGWFWQASPQSAR